MVVEEVIAVGIDSVVLGEFFRDLVGGAGRGFGSEGWEYRGFAHCAWFGFEILLVRLEGREDCAV